MILKAMKFSVVSQRAKQARDNMKNRGWTDKKYQKFLGLLPEPMKSERPEFSHNLPKAEREKNLRAFLKYCLYRVFSHRAGKRIPAPRKRHYRQIWAIQRAIFLCILVIQLF